MPRRAAQRREWVRLATLAASSHNTQPWKFRLQRDAIVIAPDYERRCTRTPYDGQPISASA